MLLDDQRLGAGKGHLRLDTIRRVGKFAFTMVKRIIRCWRYPDGKAEEIHRHARGEIDLLKSKSRSVSDEIPALAKRVALYREIYNAFPYAAPNIFSGAIAGLIPTFILVRISNHLTGSGDLALQITRGMPNNVTTEMDLTLWKIAKAIKADPAAFLHMKNTSIEELTTAFKHGHLPEPMRRFITQFMERYGMRGIGEIDIGRPRWREDPTHIMQVLGNYLKMDDDSISPDVVFQRGAQAADVAITELEAKVRQTFAGGLKARFVRAAANRVRALAGLRETPKFYIIQMMGIIRQSLLEGGRELVEAGLMMQEDDLFYLYINELEAISRGEKRDWIGLIATRRASYNREMLRKQIPRLLLSDGRAFYEGMVATGVEESTMSGSPVSPGVVEGRVRVVLDPHQADLSPGEILVCPATDPAWTPLFLTASGLVMEIGGMMTHGAIVAREYGIPAVVGVHHATTRLQTGQLVLVNGSTGQITLLEQELNSSFVQLSESQEKSDAHDT
jgi:pyruvate,water dikinase